MRACVRACVRASPSHRIRKARIHSASQPNAKRPLSQLLASIRIAKQEQKHKSKVVMTTTLYFVALVAAIAVLFVQQVDAKAFTGASSISFVGSQERSHLVKFENTHLVELLRGGASVDVDSNDEFEIESSDEEEEDVKLTKSALSAAAKVKAKAKSATKAAVSSTLQATAAVKPRKKTKSGIMKLLTIPYIVKACFNPFVLIQMTKGYWASLFNLDYLKDKVVS